MPGYSKEFTAFYDTFMGSYKKQRSIIKQLIRQYQPKGKKLLEIACGTGNMLYPFRRSHQLSGLDISKDMIRIAKEKLPQADLRVADMSTFNLNKKFDIILCFYDAINHLLSFSQWESMFEHVHKHLEPQGIFIFDLTTIHRMALRAKEPILVTKSKNIFITAQVMHPDAHTFKTRFQIIHKVAPKKWKCIEEYVEEKCYEVSKVKDALKKYFVIEDIVDPFQPKPSKRSRVLLFVCRKK